jgi:hypothetical protein
LHRGRNGAKAKSENLQVGNIFPLWIVQSQHKGKIDFGVVHSLFLLFPPKKMTEKETLVPIDEKRLLLTSVQFVALLLH